MKSDCRVISRAMSMFILVSVTTGSGALASAPVLETRRETSVTMDPASWRSFHPFLFSRRDDLVPPITALPLPALRYTAGPPAFPVDPTETSIVYGFGLDKPPTVVFAKAGDPVIIDGEIFWADCAAGRCKRVVVGGGHQCDIWSVTAYTPLADNSHIANLARIKPWRPDRVFRKTPGFSAGDWPELVCADPGEIISIDGRNYRAPGPSQYVGVNVRDSAGNNHSIIIWATSQRPVQPNEPDGRAGIASTGVQEQGIAESLASTSEVKPGVSPNPRTPALAVRALPPSSGNWRTAPRQIAGIELPAGGIRPVATTPSTSPAAAESGDSGEIQAENSEAPSVPAVKRQSWRNAPRTVAGIELPGRLADLPGRVEPDEGVASETPTMAAARDAAQASQVVLESGATDVAPVAQAADIVAGDDSQPLAPHVGLNGSPAPVDSISQAAEPKTAAMTEPAGSDPNGSGSSSEVTGGSAAVAAARAAKALAAVVPPEPPIMWVGSKQPPGQPPSASKDAAPAMAASKQASAQQKKDTAIPESSRALASTSAGGGKQPMLTRHLPRFGAERTPVVDPQSLKVDWRSFNPSSFPVRLVPDPLVLGAAKTWATPGAYDYCPELTSYSTQPDFRDDPARKSVVFASEGDKIPARVYAWAGSPVEINGRIVWAPSAGTTRKVPGAEIGAPAGRDVELVGITVYTPLASVSHIANPFGVCRKETGNAVDPRLVFYKKMSAETVYITVYGVPGDLITVLGSEPFKVPGEEPAVDSFHNVTYNDTDGKECIAKVKVCPLLTGSIQPNKATDVAAMVVNPDKVGGQGSYGRKLLTKLKRNSL